MTASPAESGKIRIDKWLWHARVVRSRSLAQQLVKAGKVRVDGTRATVPSRSVAAGNVLTITLERQIKVLEVLAPGERRGPAPEARTLYKDLSTPPTPRPVKPTRQAVREEGAGRPTKRERREIDRLRGRLPD